VGIVVRRRRWARERGALAAASGRGYWRGWVSLSDAVGLWPQPSRRAVCWQAFGRFDVFPMEVLAGVDGLRFVPSWWHRTVVGVPEVRVGWAEVAGASGRDGGHRILRWGWSLARQQVIRLELVGERVPVELRAVSDAEAAEEEMSAAVRAAEDADTVEYGKQMYGPDFWFGTVPVDFSTAVAAGLLDMVSRFAHGTPTTDPEP
jgi:hypothetical protein